MPSQFFGLQIGYSGLTAYQAALTTTGNNISNVETEGYSRQVINQKAARALRTYTTYGMAGSGTTVTSIDQVRNAYYDIKYRNAAASLGEYNIKAEYMKQIENYFSDDGELIEGFATMSDKFYNSLENLEDDPSSAAVRTTFISQSQAFTEYFKSLSEELTALQLDVNDQIKNCISQINSLAGQIANLNRQINLIELKGHMANELRDERNNLLDELSKYTDVEIKEDPIYKDAACTIESGAYRFSVTISGNQTLVDGYEYRTMYVESKKEGLKTNQSDAEGLYEIKWSDTGMKYYPISDSYTGELKGLLQMRDGNNDEYFHGKISNVDTTVGASTVTISGDLTEYLQDITKCTLNNEGTIVLKGLPCHFVGWEAETDPNGKIVSYKFKLAEDNFVNPDGSPTTRRAALADPNLIGAMSYVGTAIDYKGIPYYMEQMNEWVREFARVFNNIEESGEDLYGKKMGSEDSFKSFFIAENITDRDNDYNFEDSSVKYKADGTKVNPGNIISTDGDNYYQLTAGNFAVNTKLIADVGLMTTTANQGSINVEATDIIQLLEKIRTDKEMMTFRGCNSNEFLSCILGDVALGASSANTFTANFEDIRDSITNQRLSVSGVDDDEEALNLVKYQNAYNLSAKMIQIMTEIYDRLILETGV